MSSKLSKQQRADAVTNEDVIRTLMGIPSGRRWLWQRLERMHIFTSTISFGHNSFAVTAFNEGQRALGLELLADITRIDPDGYIVMARESNAILEREKADAEKKEEDNE